MEHDPLIAMLNRLKLTAIRDQLDSLVDEAAQRDLTIREALSMFCEREISRKDEQWGFRRWDPGGRLLFLRLSARRYERGSMLITSNRSIGEWGTVFGDAVVATAILDRLLHHSHLITIRGDSYRLREKRRAGLLKASPITQSVPAQA